MESDCESWGANPLLPPRSASPDQEMRENKKVKVYINMLAFGSFKLSIQQSKMFHQVILVSTKQANILVCYSPIQHTLSNISEVVLLSSYTVRFHRITR